MEFMKSERELSVKELFCNVLSKWRSILFTVLIAVVITVGINVPSAKEYVGVIGRATVIKALIKQVFIIGVLTGGALVVVYVFKFLFTDTVKSVNEFKLICNINFLGSMIDESTKKTGKIDTVIKKINGIKYQKKDAERYIEHIAKVIENSIDLKGNSKVTIAIVSSCANKVCDEAVDMLKEKVMSEINLVSAGDVTMSPTAITQVIEADYVILAESIGVSKYYEIEQTVTKICEMKKNVMGMVLLNAHAI